MVTFIKKSILPILAISICILSVYIVTNVSAVSKNIELHKDIDIGDNVINLDYESNIKSSNGEELLIYNDNDKNQYIIKDNNIVGYLQNKKITRKESEAFNKVKYSTDDIKVMPLLSNIKFDDYKLESINYVESYNETYYTYFKYINNIKVNDNVVVSFNDDGTMSSYSAPRQDFFDNLKTNITSEKIKKYVETEVARYNSKKYELEAMYIDYRDGKYVVVCDVALYYDEYIDSVELLYSL